MALTFSLAPNPRWVVIDNFSDLPIGAAIYTFSSLAPNIYKPAFKDAGGAIPYTQPIVGFANGTFPPIFWQFDSSLNPPDFYYIQVWDKVKETNADAVMLWDFSGFLGSSGGGGGGGTTTNLDLENLVINGQFYRNIGTQTGSPSIATQITLAPSNHDGFVGTPISANDGPLGPDIIFAKKDQSATDSLSFTNFPQGDASFSPAPTPQLFVNYSCTSGGTEAYKFIQFPIVKGLQNINNTNISVQMWNRLQSGSSNISLYLRQFCGNGSNAPSADVLTPLTALNFTLAGQWNLTTVNSFIVPGIGALTLGNCGNDALYLQIRFPSSTTFSLDFILPSFYIGTVNSQNDFHTLDFVDSIVNSPRTGDVRTSINSFAPYGWVQMNDGTIGNASSQATARKNIDTFPLFDLLWNTFQATPSLAPMLNSAGVPLLTYGASSVADFSANNQLTLTRNLGRVMAGTLPAQTTLAFTTPVANTLTVGSTAALITGAGLTISGSSNTAILGNGVTYYVNISSPTAMTIYKTANDAINLTNPILFGINAVTGNIIFPAHALGSFIGNEAYFLQATDLAPHTHPTATGNNFVSAGGAGSGASGGGARTDPATGFNQTANQQTATSLIQPTVYMNIFIKL